MRLSLSQRRLLKKFLSIAVPSSPGFPYSHSSRVSLHRPRLQRRRPQTPAGYSRFPGSGWLFFLARALVSGDEWFPCLRILTSSNQTKSGLLELAPRDRLPCGSGAHSGGRALASYLLESSSIRVNGLPPHQSFRSSSLSPLGLWPRSVVGLDWLGPGGGVTGLGSPVCFGPLLDPLSCHHVL